ncbi:MAG: dehydrogenase (quinone) subunit, partial [Verrucomicrobiota bacterium]
MATQTIEFKDAAGRAAHVVPSQGPSSGDDLQDLHGDKMVLNMGPSHPSTHGVLRILIELDGETVTKAVPDVGYLHRGDEKIAENMTYNQFVPYT